MSAKTNEFGKVVMQSNKKKFINEQDIDKGYQSSNIACWHLEAKTKQKRKSGQMHHQKAVTKSRGPKYTQKCSYHCYALLEVAVSKCSHSFSYCGGARLHYIYMLTGSLPSVSTYISPKKGTTASTAISVSRSY